MTPLKIGCSSRNLKRRKNLPNFVISKGSNSKENWTRPSINPWAHTRTYCNLHLVFCFITTQETTFYVCPLDFIVFGLLFLIFFTTQEMFLCLAPCTLKIHHLLLSAVPSFSLLSSQPISSHLSYLPASLKAESISALYIFSALTSVIKPHLRIVHARIGYSTSGPDSNHLASMEISNKIGIPSNAV